MKIRVRNILFIGGIILTLIFLMGCGTLETLINKDGTGTSLGDFIGGDRSDSLPAVSTASTMSPSEGSVEINLYFADTTGKYLVEEHRTVPKTLSLARETVSEWLKGPSVSAGTTEQAAVPTTTTLRDIAIKEDMGIVDLSKEFLQTSSKVSPEVALYGLVNTLTQFPTIKQVQIRVEGKPLTKYGTIDATNLVNKASLVKENDSASVASKADSNANSAANNNASSNSNPNPVVSSPGTDKADSEPPQAEKKTNGGSQKSPSSINLFDYSAGST